MPHLNSFKGLRILPKYVSNWYSVLALYANIIKRVNVKFRDGFEVEICKRKKEAVNTLSEGFGFRGSITWLQNSANFNIFYEEIYKRYLQDNGFNYQINQHNTIVTTPSGLRIVMTPPYSFVLDEIFVMKVYGEPNLNGRIAIDIGASIGDSSLYFSSLGAIEVYSYEVDRERFEIALRNIELNNLNDKIKLFNEAATAASVQEIILKNNYDNVFIKIDCEGCEYEIMHRLPNEVFLRITDLVLEYHQDPNPILEKLRVLNYQVYQDRSVIYAKQLTMKEKVA